jgi:tetratricopeptide (TPR) repeat protein
MAHYDLGLVYEARGQWEDAASAYRKEIEVSPKLYQPHFNLAKLLSRAGRHAEAVVHFRQAVALEPAFAEGHLYLAKSLLDTGDLAGAEAEARRGLAAGPGQAAAPLAHYVLADVYSRLGRPRDAAREAAMGQRLEERARASRRPSGPRTASARPGRTQPSP